MSHLSVVLNMGISTSQTTAGDVSENRRTTSTLVRCRLPTESFALHETFQTSPDLTVECAPSVAASGAACMSLLWAETDTDDLTATLETDPTVSAVDELYRAGDRHFYRIQWSHDIHCRTAILLQSEGILLKSQGTDSRWAFDLLYPDRETLHRVSERCKQYDLSLAIDTIRSLDPDQRTQYGLTPIQHTTLSQACQEGYFNVPREIGLDDLAEKMGVSHQALSERLRRGHDALIKAALLGTHPTPPTAPNTLSL